MGKYTELLLPNLISIAKGILLLIVAFIVAAIVKKLVSMILTRILPKKDSNTNSEFCSSIIKFTARISYIVVFLLFVPGIFSLMGVDAAAGPIIKMLEGIVAFIPNIIVAILIIYIGMTLSRLCGAIVERLLKTSKMDELIVRLIPEEKKMIPISRICSTVVEMLLIIFFVVQGLDVLHLEILDGIGTAVIGYLPCVLAASLIFTGCFCLDSFLGAVLEKGGHYGVSMLTKVVIYVIGVFMILSQLGIATTIVNSAFIIIIAAIAVAFAISFGIGGRGFAEKILSQLEESWKSEK